VARIERGTVVPRVDTLDNLLQACDQSLEAVPRLGIGVDRTLIREMLKLTPAERLQRASNEANSLNRFVSAVRRK
jgi:predicted transcriptional regulator